METEVARKIENSVATLQGIKHIYTKVQDGTATVTVEFRLEKADAGGGRRRARRRLAHPLRPARRPARPGDQQGQPVRRADPDLHRGLERMDDEALSWFVDNTVTKAMLAVRGVGAVARVGGVTREMRIELDPARLLALNATAADISRQLRQMQQEASGGRADVGGIEQSVRTIATVQSAEELARMEIVLSDGRRIRLDQVATVSATRSPSSARRRCSTASRWSASRSCAARGAGEVEVAEGVRAALEKLKAEHPDITITEAFNFVDPVIENYEGSMALLIEGRCSPCSSSGSSCATGGPPSCRPRRCRCRRSRPSR
jgi:multidrug efflux pump subunit AcrB